MAASKIITTPAQKKIISNMAAAIRTANSRDKALSGSFSARLGGLKGQKTIAEGLYSMPIHGLRHHQPLF
jgi:hypothetical protein